MGIAARPWWWNLRPRAARRPTRMCSEDMRIRSVPRLRRTHTLMGLVRGGTVTRTTLLHPMALHRRPITMGTITVPRGRRTRCLPTLRPDPSKTREEGGTIHTPRHTTVRTCTTHPPRDATPKKSTLSRPTTRANSTRTTDPTSLQGRDKCTHLHRLRRTTTSRTITTTTRTPTTSTLLRLQ